YPQVCRSEFLHQIYRDCIRFSHMESPFGALPCILCSCSRALVYLPPLLILSQSTSCILLLSYSITPLKVTHPFPEVRTPDKASPDIPSLRRPLFLPCALPLSAPE